MPIEWLLRKGTKLRGNGRLIYAIALSCSILLPSAQAQGASLVVGSFNMARGGGESLANGGLKKLRAAIAQSFPGSSFLYSKKLSHTYLAKVDVVVLGAAYGATQPIVPLTAQEQKALVDFVKAGGVALLFCDNDYQFSTASNSFVNPFGLTSTGLLSGGQAATFLTLATDPIQTGPFGTATQFDTVYPGWFSALGNATEVAELAANGEPEIAYLPAGSLARSSGAVVFFGDSNPMNDGERTANDQIAILNALALAP